MFIRETPAMFIRETSANDVTASSMDIATALVQSPAITGITTLHDIVRSLRDIAVVVFRKPRHRPSRARQRRSRKRIARLYANINQAFGSIVRFVRSHIRQLWEQRYRVFRHIDASREHDPTYDAGNDTDELVARCAITSYDYARNTILRLARAIAHSAISRDRRDGDCGGGSSGGEGFDVASTTREYRQKFWKHELSFYLYVCKKMTNRAICLTSRQIISRPSPTNASRAKTGLSRVPASVRQNLSLSATHSRALSSESVSLRTLQRGVRSTERFGLSRASLLSARERSDETVGQNHVQRSDRRSQALRTVRIVRSILRERPRIAKSRFASTRHVQHRSRNQPDATGLRSRRSSNRSDDARESGDDVRDRDTMIQTLVSRCISISIKIIRTMFVIHLYR